MVHFPGKGLPDHERTTCEGCGMIVAMPLGEPEEFEAVRPSPDGSYSVPSDPLMLQFYAYRGPRGEALKIAEMPQCFKAPGADGKTVQIHRGDLMVCERERQSDGRLVAVEVIARYLCPEAIRTMAVDSNATDIDKLIPDFDPHGTRDLFDDA